MLSSEYLYGESDRETALLQRDLFKHKKAKAYQLIEKLKPDFNLLNFSPEQKELELRITKIRKAIDFANNMIEEAEAVLNDKT